MYRIQTTAQLKMLLRLYFNTSSIKVNICLFRFRLYKMVVKSKLSKIYLEF